MTRRLDTPAGPASADVDHPPGADAQALLVLTHGAGGDPDTRDLLAVRDLAVQRGIAVARVTQPYRVAGRRTPPRPETQDPAWTAALAALRRRDRAVRDLPLVAGGRSNGARVACRCATATGAVGVVALAFPLHPPSRPENTRLPELDAAGVPVLVVQGDRDPFGMPPAGAGRTVSVVAGATHSLAKDTGAVARAVVEFVVAVTAPRR